VNDVLTANKAIARTDLDVTYFCSVRKDSGFITQMNELVASGQGVDWRATVYAFSSHARIRPDRLLQLVLSSLAENHPLNSHTECKNLFKPRKGEPTRRADNQANCLSGAILS